MACRQERLITGLSRTRLTSACRTVKRIGALPHSLKDKATFTRMCALSGGLYACEASSADEVQLQYLSTAITTMLQP
eukprot:3876077-Karenia_brevis.AAC.1